ncbi:MAG: type VI secretion system tip protein TssI/VgrG [Nannocystaceae bacterium]
MSTPHDPTLALLGDRALVTIDLPAMRGSPRVVGIEGHEGLSTPFELRVEVAVDEGVDLDAVVGAPVSLRFEGLDGPRHVHGEVASVDYTGETPRYALYELLVTPSIGRLALRHGSRIFQHRTTPEVALEVLRIAGFRGDAVRLDLTATYEPRGYCVQYRESDLAFLSRVLEEDGIFYFFEHGPERTTLVLGDHPGAHPPIPGTATLSFNPGGELRDREQVTAIRFGQALRPGRVALRDHNLHEPDRAMDASAEGPRDVDLEHYEHRGEYQDPDADGPHGGAGIARARLQAIEATRRQITGQSDCPRMSAGCTFTLTDHPREELCRELLLTRVTHHLRQPQALDEHARGEFRYRCELRCIDAETPFRPPRITPRPRVAGIQTATVVGAGTEEVHTDEHGRVLVHFHWDREGPMDEGASCWVRVSQAWAGPGYGALFLPRVGHEVLVDFIEGDPDRPIITGRVYHGRNAPPYPLPDEKTRSALRSESSPGGGGFNELSFEDAKGREEVFLHAQRDLREVALRSNTRRVGVDQSISIGHDQRITVERDRAVTVKEGDESLTVDRGSSTTVVERDRSVVVRSGDASLTVAAGARSVSVHGPITERSASASLELTAHTSMSLTADTSTLSATAEQAVTIASRSATLTVRAPQAGEIAITGGPLGITGHAAVSLESTTSTLALSSKAKASLASDDAVDLVAAKGVHVDGGQEVTIAARKISLSAVEELTLGVGACTITIKPGGITISGPSLKSSAVGLHEISGALIKIN